MKKLLSGVMVGLITSTFAVTTMAAPAQPKDAPKHEMKNDHKVPPKKDMKNDRKAPPKKDMKNDHKAPPKK